MFIPFIHIYPEQEYIMNALKDILFRYGRLSVWSKTSTILQTVVVGNILRIVEPYLLTAKACKNQNLRMLQIFVDSNFFFFLYLCTKYTMSILSV